MPFKSEDAEAAVGEVLATVFVLVSDMWILDTGIPKLRAATCTGKLNWGVKIAKKKETNDNSGKHKGETEWGDFTLSSRIANYVTLQGAIKIFQ